jgi:hypothetical protein
MTFNNEITAKTERNEVAERVKKEAGDRAHKRIEGSALGICFGKACGADTETIDLIVFLRECFYDTHTGKLVGKEGVEFSVCREAFRVELAVDTVADTHGDQRYGDNEQGAKRKDRIDDEKKNDEDHNLRNVDQEVRKDVAEEVKETIEITPVSNVVDVLREVGVLELVSV